MRKSLLFFILFLLFDLSAFGQCGLTVNFGYSSTGCRILQFSDSTTTSSSYTPISWKWYFGDGDTATGPTASHYYNNTVSSQNLDVKLVVIAEDPYGNFCSDSLTKTITINTIPTVNIFSDPNSPGCLSDTVQFYGFSNQKIASWSWNFDDGGTSNLQNPLYHYADTGTYSVNLYVVDSAGCTNSATYQYKVQSPTVGFTISSNPASTLDTLLFKGSSNINVLTWNWTFGDGATANVQNPTHRYTSNGTYNVKLSVLTDNLCTASVTQTDTIETLPYANFTFTGHCLGNPTTFTDESYTISSGIKKWVWNFGDGTDSILTISDVNVQHPVVNHTYTNPGDYAVTLTVTNAYGNTRSRTKSVVISSGASANFSYIQTCFYDTTSFTDQSTDTTISSWKWSFGDGYYSTAQDTLHKYLSPGTYPVKLVITNIYGCSDSIQKNVVIDSLPTVSITMAKSKLCLGETDQFYGNSADTVTWHWDFGDGDTSAYQNPLPYQYTATGTYTVTLKVTDKNSCSSSTSDTVMVMDNPKVDFSYSSNTCKTDSISFIDKTTTTTGILTSFTWNFGDTTSTANQSVKENPLHYFSGGAGSYKVQLLATNNYGCADSAYKYVKIYDTPKPGFTYHQLASPMTKVDFTDTTVESTNHSPISSYLWTFYQNDTSQQQNPSYNFPAYDSCYNVMLTVTDTNGCSNTDTSSVCLVPPPPVDFTISQDTACIGTKITFNGQATNIATWHWNFGDGDTSTYQNITHQYTASGTYSVTLSVTDLNGYSNSVTHKVFISGNPVANFSYSSQTCQTDSIDFLDKTTTPSGGLSSFQWDFGDTASVANQSTQQNPVHYFSGGAGTYKVQLVATNTYGCVDSTYKYVKIYDTPKAGFSYSQLTSPMTEVSFTDTSKQSRDLSPINSYLWSFYKGDISNSANPSYNFPNTGQCYPVTLTVTDTNGCANTDTVDVCLVPPPPVDFTVSQDTVCLGTKITFSGQATNIASWHWNFGNGDTSIYQNQVYQYPATGKYSVTLSVTNVNGYSNSVTHTVFVSGNPQVNFSYGSQTCKTDSVSFLDKTTVSSGIITSYSWNFGDATSTSNQSALQNPVHYFSGGAGSYKVKLVATNTYGCVDSTYKYVKIYDTPKAGFTYHQLASPMTKVDFTDTSAQSTNHSPISTYLWTFYQNDTSQQQNPSYDFPAYDSCYNVVLTVTDTNGCSNTDTSAVCLVPPPPVDFTMSQDTACVGEMITFNGQASNIASWHWNFGDGDTSIYQNPSYQYVASGTYSVTLSVTDINGYSNSVTHKIFISGKPQVNFSNGSQTCKTDSVSFLDKTTVASGIISSYKWSFGDPTSSANQSVLQNPKHYFKGGAGSYKVQLVATNTFGCADSTYKYVKVYDTPKAGFTYHQLASPMTKVDFTDTSAQSTNHSPISTYLWTFYQNDTSQQQNPSYDFPAYDSCYNVVLTVTDTNGCSNADTSAVCLVPPPPVDFTISNDTACVGEMITFNGQANNIASWHWNFGNGDTSIYQNTTDQYVTSGTYSVTLSVTDVNGYSNSVPHKIFISGKPQVNFSYGPQTCKTDSVSFLDKTTVVSGMISSFKWSFGDPTSSANQSVLQNPKHYFKGGAGSYKVQLVATNTYGCVDSAYKYVKVYDTPKAGFTYHQLASPMTKVDFTDTSVQSTNHSPISAYLWTFYQNDTSQLQNPSYDFPAYDSCYNVVLTVTDTNGCSNTDTSAVCLVPPPPVDFTMSQDTICLGEKITFSGQASNIASWHWSFGDGDTSVYQNQVYQYPAFGTYTVTLSVTDVNGYSNSVKHKVFVSANPQVNFSYGPQTCQTDSVPFMDKTTTASGGLSAFQWDFGDTASVANQSTQQNPQHYFDGGAGSYKVQLIATNSFGCSDSTYKYVKIYDSPQAGFKYIQLPNPMTKVSFTDTSQEGRNWSPISTYLWSFYKGDVSDSVNPSYDFPKTGQCYPVTLTVTDTNGCANTDTVDVCLVPPPPVDFTMSQDTICLGEKITFSGQASNIASWHWNFGNGDTSVYQNQVYQYPAAGTYTVTLSVTNVDGYSNSVKHTLFVSGNPKVDFTYGRACQRDSVNFLDKTTTSSGALTVFKWDFGDTASVANQSAQENPAHYFNSGAGSYYVKLYVSNTYGCSDSLSKFVKVHDTPKAGFTYHQLNSPLTEVNFTDTSQQSRDHSPIGSYLWTFYNGDVSDSANPSYEFPGYGQCYSVKLMVTDTNGCSDTDTVDVCLQSPPSVDFTMSQDTICLGEKISFSGQASNIASWHWDFGNSDTSNYQNLTYKYPASGTYTVTLSVTDLNGFTNSVKHKVFVSSNPKADFIFGSACQTDSVYFSDRTINSSGIVVSQVWDFGDTASVANASLQQNPAHYFSNGAGSYHVKLYVRNTYGCSDTIYKYVKVHDNPKAGFIYSQECSPRTVVNFTDTSQQSRDQSPIKTYLWSFYNGDVSDSVNPSYNFPGYGQCYPVTLTVTDTNGCSNTDTLDVCLLPPPPVDFTMSQDTICLGENITFKGQASNVVNWRWDFGNGDTSIYQDQTYQYPAAGTYTVTLTITNQDGCSNSVKHKVFVSGNPETDFSYGRTCQTDSVDFYDRTTTSSGIMTSFSWDFGDTTSTVDQSSRQNPVHYFSRGAGSYKVRLIATNSYGCSDSANKYVKIYDSPKAGFTYSQLNNPMSKVQFTDTSQLSRDQSPISSYLWGFYNGDVSDSTNPSYNFPNAGKCYSVTLTVTDTNGCANTGTQEVCLVSPPPVDFTMSQDTICLGERITFNGEASNVVNWHWDLGNGDTSMYQEQTYQYPAAGTYTVTLSITNLDGYSNTVKHKVFVSANPKADFISGTACRTDSVYFSDRTICPSGVVTSQMWNFDDSASVADQSVRQNPAHYFVGGVGSYHVKLYVTNTYGCSDSVYKYVKVHDTPKARFTYNQLANPLTKVEFTDSSQESRDRSPISTYLWRFYNGDVSDSVNPSYNFPGYGQCYPVTLMVTDTNGCSNQDTVDVCLLPPAALNFTMSRVCIGYKTHFQATYIPSSDTIGYYYKWNFGDGSKVIYTYYDTITHNFSKPGLYNVQLTAVSTSGPAISLIHQATVDSLPNPDFTFITPSCDEATSFEAPTWGGGCPIKTWSWNFGDTISDVANTSDYWNPSHLYMSKDSIYYVSLVVTNANGCVDSITKPVFRSSCAYVYFKVSDIRCSGRTVYFKDRSSLNSSLGKITQWNWDFGDGSVKTYTSHQDSVSHIYESAGSYKVILTEQAIVNNLPASGTYDSVIAINQSPRANFGYSPACIGQTVYFDDSTTANNTGIRQWQWAFNDPFSSFKYSTMENPKHNYNSTGYYPTQLVVTDNDNCSDTMTKSVEVHVLPIAAFKIEGDYNGIPGQLYFDNESKGASTYFWEFGDGATSEEENPVYSYLSSRVFNVVLIATNKYFCSDTATSMYDLTSGLYVPNSFAPTSGNPKLNIFEPVGVHLKEYDIQVYSSWGNLLWESTKLDANGAPVEGWDGTYKGQPMPEGDYIWRITATFLDGSQWKGSDNGDGNKKPYGKVLLIR